MITPPRASTVKGFLLVGMIDIVKKQRPQDWEEQLRQHYQGPTHFNILHDYPYETALDLLNGITIILYGQASDANLEKMGRQIWQLISSSIFGKTLMRMFGTHFKELAEQAPRFYEMIAPSGGYQYTDLGPTAYKLRYVNDLAPPAMHVGINKAAAERFGIKPEVKVEKVDGQTFEIEVRW